jgi:hypothetical protein
MLELNPPHKRIHPTSDPLHEHIKACLVEVLRTAQHVREEAYRERLRRAIIHEFSRPTDDGDDEGILRVPRCTISLDL